MADVGVVILSMGNRPDELNRALAALARQRDVTLDVVVVGNGWTPVGMPPEVSTVALPDNVGVPRGRNIGADAVEADLLLFFDDDLDLPDDGFVADVVARFRADPALGVLQPRAVAPDGSSSGRRHVPRLRVSDPTRSGDVVWFWEGCSFIRRAAFAAAGGWADAFWYGHEGIELGWRVIDAGYRVHYAADLVVVNPPATPFRQPGQQRVEARNRVWVARRNLPHPLLETYVLVWAVITLGRAWRSPARLVASLRGYADGIRQSPGERRPIAWRSALRMTRLGRPPVI